MSDEARSAARQAQGLVLAGMAYAAWGLLGPVGKKLLVDFEPMTLNAVRSVAALAILLLVAGRPGRAAAWRLTRQPPIVILVLAGYGVSFTFYLYSLERLSPVLATIAFYSAPLWTALFARRRLGEHVGPWFLPAFALLGLGTYMASTGTAGTAGLAGISGLGLGLALLSAITWADYTVRLRQHGQEIPLLPMLLASFAISSAYFVVLALVVEGVPDLAAVPGSAWGWMGLHVALPTTAAFALFSAALQRAPAGPVNLLVGLELLATAIWSAALLGDRFDGVQIAGLLVVMAAVTGYAWTRGADEAGSASQAG